MHFVELRSGPAIKEPRYRHIKSTNLVCSYLVGVAAEKQQVERNCCHQIDEKPPLQVVDSYPAGMWHDFVVSAHVRCAEVDQDVDYERHVDWKEREMNINTLSSGFDLESTTKVTERVSSKYFYQNLYCQLIYE